MNNNTIIGMTALVVIGILVLMVLHILPISSDNNQKMLRNGETRGMAVVHDGLPFTLNFEQQQTAIDALNSSVYVKKEGYPAKDTLNIQKIVVYRFNAPDLELTPIQFVEDNLVYDAPALNSEYYFLELSGGDLKKMLTNAFDQ